MSKWEFEVTKDELMGYTANVPYRKRTPVQWLKDLWESFLVGLGPFPGVVTVLCVVFVVTWFVLSR